MRNLKPILAAAFLGVIVLASRQPTADIRLITHDARDPAPHKIEAAVDLGLVGISVLYTWTVDRLH
jgi:hypothetical protein